MGASFTCAVHGPQAKPRAVEAGERHSSVPDRDEPKMAQRINPTLKAQAVAAGYRVEPALRKDRYRLVDDATGKTAGEFAWHDLVFGRGSNSFPPAAD